MAKDLVRQNVGGEGSLRCRLVAGARVLAGRHLRMHTAPTGEAIHVAGRGCARWGLPCRDANMQA